MRMLLLGGIYHEKPNTVNASKLVPHLEESPAFCHICLDMEEVVWDIRLPDVPKQTPNK